MAAQGDSTAPGNDAEALALALVQAAAVGNLPAIEAALQRGAAVDAVPASSRKGWTALLCAADGGHLAVTQCLLQHAASTSIACGPQRVLPLQRAALMAEAEVVGALLQAGADPNALDAEGWTPLMKAAYSHGDADTIRVLLAGGADCSLRLPASAAGEQGATALDLALKRKHAAAAALLQDEGGA